MDLQLRLNKEMRKNSTPYSGSEGTKPSCVLTMAELWSPIEDGGGIHSVRGIVSLGSSCDRVVGQYQLHIFASGCAI